MSRPRGYAAWAPRDDALVLIDQVRAVLAEYREHLPLTVRQIFYRLVGAYDYPKTERDYKRLCERLVRARRAEMIPFAAIRDDGTKVLGSSGEGFAGPDEFWEDVRGSAAYYSRNRQEGQPYRIELWCEAAGMLPQLARVASGFDVQVFSTGGFSSVTVTHEIGQRAIASERPTVFIHIGDFDPSGASIFEAMSEDAEAFVAGDSGDPDRFQAIRLALTAEQVREYDLPTAPPKASDSRSATWFEETCQAEAMPPDLLAEIIRGELERWVDLDQRAEVLEREKTERDELEQRIAAMMEDE